MQRSYAVLSLCLILCSSAFSEERGTIQCDTAFTTHIPAWTAPGSAHAVEQLNCGQLVSVIGLERGYVKIQIANRVAYVDAKYVRLAKGAQSTLPIHTIPDNEPMIPDFSVPGKTRSYSGETRRHRGTLAFEISHIYYDEPDFVRDKGFVYGVSGDYTFRPDNFMLKAEGRFSIGNLDYWAIDGSTAEGVRDYYVETRLSVGYDLKTPSRKAIFTPFIGLGDRYLFDNFSSVGPGGYDRKQNYLYTPIGMETTFRLAPRWVLGLTGEYDLFWHGWNHSELGKAGLGLVPLKFDQNDGWGSRSSVKVIRNVGRIDLAIEPFFRYWSVARSDISYSIDSFDTFGETIFFGFPFVEPHNTTTEWGLKMGIGF